MPTMHSCVGHKRRRPSDSVRRRRDDIQLDFLAGLRVIENLGTVRPTNDDAVFDPETPLLLILNFIALIVEADTSRPDRPDIAVSVATFQGRLQLLLVKSNGSIPTHDETENLALFIQTLRNSLREDELDADIASKRFTKMIAQRHLPEIFRKLSRIGTVEGLSRKENWERFSCLLPLWQKANPRGERSQEFVDQARRRFGLIHGEIHADELMFETMKNIILHDDTKLPAEMTAQERYFEAKSVMESTVRMIKSNFFQSIIQEGPFHNMLDEDDHHFFLFEMYRRIHDVARYLTGLRRFVQDGMTYISKVLGQGGLERFFSRKGGITSHWIVQRSRRPRTLYWGSCPKDKIRRLLQSRRLAIEDFRDEEYDRLARKDEVTGLWSRGAPVTPVLHAEIQMILHIEEEYIPVLDCTIGMTRPPCWLCSLYMGVLSPYLTPSAQWTMSHTSGKARGSWRIPPSCYPALRDWILENVEKRVYTAVEEYGFEWGRG